MSELHLISPLLDGMTVESEVSTHGGISVFRTLHTATGTRCIVKRISVPESDADTAALILTGAVKNNEEATNYYLSVVNRYREELGTFRQIAQSPYVCSYARFQVVQKKERPGFDIYLLAPCRMSLRSYLENNAISQTKAVQLGMDLCRGLQALRDNGYVYLDLKPENIFLERGNFCIGDFGLAAQADIRHAALPVRYRSSFTAPEACGTTAEMGETLDLYAVGMMLYYIYNGNHVPFEEAGSTEKAADNRRVSGEQMPAPLYADYEMDAIIRKACAFKPEDRYQTPAELLAALEDYLVRNTVTEECIVPPLVMDEEVFEEDEVPEIEEEEPAPVSFTDVETLSDDFKQSFAPATDDEEDDEDYDEPPKKRRLWIPVVLIVLALIAGAVVYLYLDVFAIAVDKVTITDKGTDFLTISVEATDFEKLMISCTPEGGSTTATYRCAEEITFTDLEPGTTYQVSVSALDWHYVKGITGGTAATAAITEIVSFEAVDNGDGSAQVSFQVSGPEPEEWTVVCTGNTGDVLTFPAADRACTLTGLLPNCDYTLALDAGEGFYLSGTTEIPYSYSVPIEGSNLTATEITETSITVTWESDSDIATQWTAVCSGENGYAKTVITEECKAVFEGTEVNSEYTIAVSNAAMAMPLLLTVESTAHQISEFTATAEGTSVHLEWSAEGSSLPETMVLTYGPSKIAEPETMEVTGTSVDLENLIPNCTYTFTLSDPEGNKIGGTVETTAEIGESKLYEDHDFGGIYIALFEKPGESWTAGALGEAFSKFAPGTPIVCVIESNIEPQEQEEPETIAVRIVIRDNFGDPVGMSAIEEYSWNDMWQGKIFAEDIDMVPTEDGYYKLELYFNNELLRTYDYTAETGFEPEAETETAEESE